MANRKNKYTNDEKNKFLYLLVDKNWDQVKYVKNIVTWFAEIYMGLIVGVIAILSSDYDIDALKEVYIFLTLFFLIVSLLGISLTWRANNRIKKRTKIGRKIAKTLGARDYIIEKNGDLCNWEECLTAFYVIMGFFWIVLTILIAIS